MAHNYAHYQAFNTYPNLLAASTKRGSNVGCVTLERRALWVAGDDGQVNST